MPGRSRRDACLEVTVFRDDGGGTPLRRVVDVAKGAWSPFSKELGLRALALHPGLGGAAWEIALERVGDEVSDLRLRATSYLSGDGDLGPLARMEVPLGNAEWIANDIAALFPCGTSCKYVVEVLPRDHPRVISWDEATRDDDTAAIIDEDPDPPLRLPRGFSREPVGETVCLYPGGWLRCVFTRETYAGFTDAAARESRVERGWFVRGRVHVSAAKCCVVVEELVEMPAVTSREAFVTHGVDLVTAHHALGERLAGFAHLHPPSVRRQSPGGGEPEVVPLSATPSVADEITARNMDLTTPSPLVLPIAVFGTGRDMDVGRVRAYGFEGGVLTEIGLEVLR